MVRTWKETDQQRHTHILETAEGGTWSGHGKKPTNRGTLTSWRRQREALGQDMERNRLTEVHSHAGDGGVRDLSGRGMRPTNRGTLTNWRRHREGLGQDTERNRPTEAHSHPGDGIGRGLSGHRRKSTEQQAWALTSWRMQREGQVGTWKESSKRVVMETSVKNVG